MEPLLGAACASPFGQYEPNVWDSIVDIAKGIARFVRGVFA